MQGDEMRQYTGMACSLETYTGPAAEKYELSLFSIAFGVLAYIIIIVPIISFLLVVLLNLSSAYVIPVGIAWALAGIYVTERYICR